MFGLHELILCDFEDDLSVLLCIYIDEMEMFGLHEVILCEFEEYFSVLLCIHSECNQMFGLHEQILYVFEELLSVLLCIHIDIGVLTKRAQRARARYLNVNLARRNRDLQLEQRSAAWRNRN